MTKLMFLSLAILAVPVGAAEPPTIETRVVATADLDLTSSTGRAALDRRIERAAAEVCGTAASVDLAGRNAVRECRNEVVASARPARDQRIAAVASEPIFLAAR